MTRKYTYNLTVNDVFVHSQVFFVQREKSFDSGSVAKAS